MTVTAWLWPEKLFSRKHANGLPSAENLILSGICKHCAMKQYLFVVQWSSVPYSDLESDGMEALMHSFMTEAWPDQSCSHYYSLCAVIRLIPYIVALMKWCDVGILLSILIWKFSGRMTCLFCIIVPNSMTCYWYSIRVHYSMPNTTSDGNCCYCGRPCWCCWWPIVGIRWRIRYLLTVMYSLRYHLEQAFVQVCILFPILWYYSLFDEIRYS